MLQHGPVAPAPQSALMGGAAQFKRARRVAVPGCPAELPTRPPSADRRGRPSHFLRSDGARRVAVLGCQKQFRCSAGKNADRRGRPSHFLRSDGARRVAVLGCQKQFRCSAGKNADRRGRPSHFLRAGRAGAPEMKTAGGIACRQPLALVATGEPRRELDVPARRQRTGRVSRRKKRRAAQLPAARTARRQPQKVMLARNWTTLGWLATPAVPK